MLKLIVVIIVVLVLYMLWKRSFLHKINQNDDQQHREYIDLVKNNEKNHEKIVQNQTQQNEQNLPPINEEEQRLFDEVAQFFFAEKINNRVYQNAEQIQHHFLKNMPASTLSQIEKHDLEEWSIYWGFAEQSLEYYVGKYGVFYAHVDRFGVEHKYEMLDNEYLL